MEHSFGIFLLHVITLQWDVFYPATLGKQQVCPWWQRVDIGARAGSHSGWHYTMVDA